MNGLDLDVEAMVTEELGAAGVDQPAGSPARAVAVVAGVIRDLDQVDGAAHPAVSPWFAT
jgi:hypothetical protein